MAAITAAAIGAGAGILGDAMSSSSAAQTNETQMAIAAMNNKTMIDLAKNAETYRFADYQRAGVNPMLVTGSTGMQVPQLQQPMLQNPGQSWSNLGNQVSSAMQLATQNAQIDALKAQAANAKANARNTDAQTDTVLPEQVKQIQANTGLQGNQSRQVADNVAVLDYALSRGIAYGSADLDYQLKGVQLHISQMDAETQLATQRLLIRARNDESLAKSIGAENLVQASDGVFGKIMAYFDVPGATNAISSAKGLFDLIPQKRILETFRSPPAR